ncbi:MAG TPA: hypothetical protein VHG53_00220 [Candidatus Limnocylindria bacterium]|nr:hypothetical protein [Candidatus Limnocylindria bacterium]
MAVVDPGVRRLRERDDALLERGVDRVRRRTAAVAVRERGGIVLEVALAKAPDRALGKP